MNSGNIVLVLGDGGVGKTSYIALLKNIVRDVECYKGTRGAGMISIIEKQPTHIIVLFNWSIPSTYADNSFKKWIDYARKNFSMNNITLCGTKRNDEIISGTNLAKYYLSIFPKLKKSDLHQVIGWKYAYEDDIYYHTIDLGCVEGVSSSILDYEII